jgi:hypothetical protein
VAHVPRHANGKHEAPGEAPLVREVRENWSSQGIEFKDAPPAAPGLQVLPVRNGVELNEKAADLFEQYDGSAFFFSPERVGAQGTAVAMAAANYDGKHHRALFMSEDDALSMSAGESYFHERAHLEDFGDVDRGIPTLTAGGIMEASPGKGMPVPGLNYKDYAGITELHGWLESVHFHAEALLKGIEAGQDIRGTRRLLVSALVEWVQLLLQTKAMLEVGEGFLEAHPEQVVWIAEEKPALEGEVQRPVMARLHADEGWLHVPVNATDLPAEALDSLTSGAEMPLASSVVPILRRQLAQRKDAIQVFFSAAEPMLEALADWTQAQDVAMLRETSTRILELENLFQSLAMRFRVRELSEKREAGTLK